MKPKTKYESKFKGERKLLHHRRCGYTSNCVFIQYTIHNVQYTNTQYTIHNTQIHNTQLCNTQYTCCIICGRWVYCKLSWEWPDAALVQFLMRRNVDSWGAITGHQGEITNSHLQINIKCNISLITRLSSLDITNSHSDINIYSDIIL